MPDVVREANIQNSEKLKAYIAELFKKEQYAEIILAIGMHSLLVDMQHTLSDQAELYRVVLNMLKDRIRNSKGKAYAAWYEGFPKLLDELVSANKIVTDKPSADVLASHRSAFGPFRSVEDFYFWALQTDRRLTLDQIVKYMEKTAQMRGRQ
jgi:hypothetical protein